MQENREALEPISVEFYSLGKIKRLIQQSNSFESLDYAIKILESKVFQSDVVSAPLEEIHFFNNAYAKWEAELEQRYILKFLNMSVKSYKDYPLYERFVRLIEREVNLLRSYPPPLNILFIGMGSFPISALLYNQVFGSSLTCLDYDPITCQNASYFIKKLGLEKDFQFICTHGEIFKDISFYDLIVVALLAFPKEKILKNILENASYKAFVICRTSESSRILLYKNTDPQEFIGWDVIGKGCAGDGDTISSLCLQKSFKLRRSGNGSII